MLAEVYDKRRDHISGWFVSEKLDGVRAYWDGHALCTRNGHRINAPAEWLHSMPRMVLDGELYAGRGGFEYALSAAQRAVPDATEWERIQFWAFDAPRAERPFGDVVSWIDEEARASIVCACVPQTRLTRISDLPRLLREVVQSGGEGLMLRNPRTAWAPGRTRNLLKIKPARDDEAVVLGQEDNGTLRCSWQDVEFSVSSGLSAKLKTHGAFAPGDVITFTYFGTTKNGVPRHPSFSRRRLCGGGSMPNADRERVGSAMRGMLEVAGVGRSWPYTENDAPKSLQAAIC